jgi:pimeloyl-ACP methyl ester carboxylesterase
MDAELQRWYDEGDFFDYLGFDVFYRRGGSGPVLLLIHGYPFNSFDWSPIWTALTERFTVIAPDLLGMGFSAKPVHYRYSVPDHADAVEALLAHLGVGEAHILAHDLGDSVGQELLARHEFGDQSYGGLKIHTITWLNGGLFHEAYTPRAVQKLMSDSPLGPVLGRLAGSPLSQRMADRTIDSMFGPRTKPTPRMKAQFDDILSFNDGKRVSHLVGRFLGDRYVHRNRWVRAMRETTVPMRLIDGPIDPNSGRHMAQRYLQIIPDPDVVMLADDIGHWPQLEAPDDVLRHFLAHIDAHAGTRDGRRD